uniref:Putative dermacentor 9 kDa family member n=1 Tax=Rhipicephalus pulchellus TaxID=72859 RepID=L7MCC1_RHIPC
MASLQSRMVKTHVKYLYTFALLVLLQVLQTETQNATCYPYCGGITPKPYCYDNGNGSCTCICTKPDSPCTPLVNNNCKLQEKCEGKPDLCFCRCEK